MQYKDLKEMKFKDWDGEPFEAYYTDNPDGIIDRTIIEFFGYVQGKWFSDASWNHVYPVEWNKEKVEESLKPKRMTNRQLAKWLAKGNEECLYNNTVYYLNAYNYHCYDTRHANDFVSEDVRVRKWDSEEWVEPTVDLLED